MHAQGGSMPRALGWTRTTRPIPMHTYENVDDFTGTLQHLRQGVHIVMPVDMPRVLHVLANLGDVNADEHQPFDGVVGPLVCERVESVAGINLGANHVVSLLLWIVMSAIRVQKP